MIDDSTRRLDVAMSAECMATKRSNVRLYSRGILPSGYLPSDPTGMCVCSPNEMASNPASSTSRAISSGRSVSSVATPNTPISIGHLCRGFGNTYQVCTRCVIVGHTADHRRCPMATDAGVPRGRPLPRCRSTSSIGAGRRAARRHGWSASLFGPGERKALLSQGFFQSGRRASNPRPSAWEADALPTELRPRCGDHRTWARPGRPGGHPVDRPSQAMRSALT